MDFAKLLSNQDRLTRGDARITVNPKQSLEQFAESVQDQKDDITEVMAEMTEEDLLDFTAALDEAIAGLVNAGECMQGLGEISAVLREHEDMEQQKLYPIANKVRGGLADLGKILMTLKKAATRAHDASWKQ